MAKLANNWVDQGVIERPMEASYKKIIQQLAPLKSIQKGMQKYQIFEFLMPKSIRRQLENFYNTEILKIRKVCPRSIGLTSPYALALSAPLGEKKDSFSAFALHFRHAHA